MNYQDQLLTEDWKRRRTSILKRDAFRCQNCFNQSLLKKFRISFHGIGTTSKHLVLIIFDKKLNSTHRCLTNYDKSYLFELLRISEKNSVVALSIGEDVFCQLIATIILPIKLDYEQLALQLLNGNESKYNSQKQAMQENYLKNISIKDLNQLQWIDTKGLHVHHKYYQVGKFAWEYPFEALTTLCWDCHEKLHNNTKIDILDQAGNIKEKKQVCERCFGAGWFPEYNHVSSGICFRCSGRRFEN